MTSLNSSYYTAINTQHEKLGFDFFRPKDSSDPPTVLQVLPALNSGGVERGTLEISDAIIASGWRSVVVSKGGMLVDTLQKNGAKHLKINIGAKNPFAWPKSLRKLKRVISEYNVDIVHARSRMPAWICKYAAQQCGVPFITTFHGRYGDTNALKKIYNSIMIRGEFVIAISKFIADDIQSRYRIEDDTLKIIPRGADISLFNPDDASQKAANRLIKEWGVPDDTPVIMLPARLTRWKGHELLIEALSLIKDVRFFCVLVGDHDTKKNYRSELEKIIKFQGLTDKVKITGHCKEMVSAYKISDIVISASLAPEPFGRITVEAQAMGCLVVAADHGGARETIQHNRTGILVEPRNSEALADGIKKALEMQTEDRKSMGIAAREFVAGNFSRETMCYRTMSLYCQLLDLNPQLNS